MTEEQKQDAAKVEAQDTQEEVVQEISEEEKNQLVLNDVYLKTGIHVGTKFKTKHMQPFIYKTRPDGLSVLNVQLIDQRLKLMMNLLAKYEPEDILVVSRRENGWKPVKLVENLTGIKCFAGRYPPGILTNSDLENFIEAKIIVVVDSWADRNVIQDALKIGIPIIALSDTNNLCNNVDLVVPCNNKGRKSLGLVFYLLAREYMKAKGLIKSEEEMSYKMDDFLED